MALKNTVTNVNTCFCGTVTFLKSEMNHRYIHRVSVTVKAELMISNTDYK